ncbi:MAG: hypothetical protein M1812_001457 [Candelaria pacifica]|nr:MAG: hypothetical protein M1812_001457 [Candelaria pacifica]
MPGRVSTRSTRTSAASTAAVSRKPSKHNTSARASTVSRISSPTFNIPEEAPSTALRLQICAIFADVQRTTAGHRKLVINLRKIHEACCYEPSKPGKNGGLGFGEEQFNDEVGRCVLRVMGVKKSESVGDKVVRFLGLFLKHAAEKDHGLISSADGDETGVFPETPSTRLTSHILSLLLPLLASKEKTVRYRSTQLVSHIINSLDSIDDDVFQLLRLGLLKRIKDKESMVRVQAVLGLGRLAGNEADEDQENQDSDDEDAGGLLERLLEVLQNDPSSDVRRSLLLNLPLTPATLPFLLERARDLDPATRRALYSRLLPALGDFRHLSLSMREKLLRWGLRDRDENVRKAAGKLFRERWIEDCAGTRALNEGGAVGETPPPNFDALLELLERIDVLNSGVENGVALEAMKEFWEGRPDYCEAVTFDDAFWDSLTPESVFMVRSFNDFCRQDEEGKMEALVEEKMPEVTKLAFFLQRYTNDLVESLRRAGEQGEGADEDETVEQEFLVEQLLHIAQTLDYTDEIGRRKMFALLRETLAIAELPEEVTRLVVDVLRGVCGSEAAGEREFCGVVLEAVAEVHDNIIGDSTQQEENEDESFHSAKSEVSSDSTPTKAKPSKPSKNGGTLNEEEENEDKAIREIMVNMKCLHIAQCMLQNVEGNLQQSIHLVTMLNNLVVPAVRSHEAPIRERGLGLAEENLSLFLHCFNKGHEALQISALHILSDILTTHPSLLKTPTPNTATLEKQLQKLFTKALKPSSPSLVQTAACTSLSKLLLTNILTPTDLLKTLVLTYFSPQTSNAGVKQCLTYFLPVYCHSRRENMCRMGSIIVNIMSKLLLMTEEADEEVEEEDEKMVSWSVIIGQLVEWTDERKLVNLGSSGSSVVPHLHSEQRDSVAVHIDIATEVLERILITSCSKEEKKLLISLLSKLHFPLPSLPTSTSTTSTTSSSTSTSTSSTSTSSSSIEKLHSLFDLLNSAIEQKIAGDATSRNALNKLVVSLGKVGGRREGRAVVEEGKTVLEEKEKTVLEEEEEGKTVLGKVGDEEEGKTKIEDEDEEEGETKMEVDSLLEKLLEDEEEGEEEEEEL